ncbi:MAG: hypothetical protein ACREE4_18435 [Stellaceae bacterium]
MTRTPSAPSADSAAALRDRLLAMRAELVETMVRDGFSAGLGALLAQIAAALAALDNAPQSLAERVFADGEPTAGASNSANRQTSLLTAIGTVRAVLADNGEAIRLTIYDGAAALGAAVLDPLRAVGLGAELIAAALLKLAEAAIKTDMRPRDGEM